MANYKNGVVFVDDISEYGFTMVYNWHIGATLESFSYDYAKSLNDGGQAFGATEPAMMEFSFRLGDVNDGQIIYHHAYQNENMRFSFIFGPQWNGPHTRLTDYQDGLVADGYIVHISEEFHSGKDSQGRERQTILHIKLLLRSVSHISGMKGKKTLTTTFVTDSIEVARKKQQPSRDSNIRFIIWNNKKNEKNEQEKMLEFVSVTGTMTDWVHISKMYTVTLQSLSLTKAIHRPNEIKARLYFYPTVGKSDVVSRNRMEKAFRHKRVELVANGQFTICNDYFIEDVVPTFTDDGNIYVDLTMYSPDYLLTTETACRSFVGKRLSEVAKQLVTTRPLPYDAARKLSLGDMASQMHHLVHNGQEHIIPYLVQYNESIYDFLRRTANRWGEFMYYDSGRLNFGYGSNSNHAYSLELASPKTEKLDYIKVCHAVSYAEPSADLPTVDSVGSISLEAAQEFLDNMLTKGEYEKPFYRNMESLGKAFTPDKNIPSWASDNLVGDLVSYGLAKRYTDEQKSQFNHSYFDDPNVGTAFNEFTENDPSAFRTFDTDTYKHVLAQELSRGRSTIQISFDTSYPNMSLCDMFSFGENSNEYYMITEISMHLEQSRPVWQAKAIRASGERQANIGDRAVSHIDFYPPYLPSGHTRQSGMLRGTVVDADDPLRQNRVRVRFEWQDDLSTPTPWLLAAQDGSTPGAGSHMRHYEGEQVLVGFIGGNVERPYVIGSIQSELPVKDSWDSPIDAILRTPNGQRIQMSDGTGAGLTAFRTAMDPAVRAMQSLVPDRHPLASLPFWRDKDHPDNQRFEGNVEISDHYHIYQIKCSTSDREVSIQSPWGQVDINAFTGINLTAPDGDIHISGKNVTVEAGNNLRLISGTNISSLTDQFLPADWAAPFSSSLAAQAAAKVLLTFSERGAIDFALLRHICDRFIKPVEGVLELQSNRFLKLEADGASTGYPVKEYKRLKAAEKTEISEENWYQMGKAVAKLIDASWALFLESYSQYCEWFENALEYKAVYEKAVLSLKEWSEAEDELHNVNGTRICHLYEDLKAKLSSAEALKEADMGFVDEMVGIEAQSATAKCENRKKDKDHQQVLAARKSARRSVVVYANMLQNSIHRVLKSQFDVSSVGEKNYLVGADEEKLLPLDYMNAVQQAFSRDKCALSALYKTMTSLDALDLTDTTYLHLANASRKDIQNQLTALKHLIALNLLEGLGFKARKNNQVVTISSLVTSEEDLLEHWDQTASCIVYEYSADDSLDSLRRKKVREQDVWSNAKNGQILISSGEPYALGKEMKPIVRQSEELRTDRLVKRLSKPIEEAMSANAINSVDHQEGSELELIIFDESNMYPLDTNPKREEEFAPAVRPSAEARQEQPQPQQPQAEERADAVAEEAPQQDERCYYQCGDILSRGGRYYVCVSRHKLHEQARFINLNDQYMHADHLTKLPWDDNDKDVDTVYADDMASAKTIYGWIKHVLFDDKMCRHLRAELTFLRSRGGQSSVRGTCPEDDDLRVEFIETLLSRYHFITDACRPMPCLITSAINPPVEGDYLPIKFFEWNDPEGHDAAAYKQTVAPTGFLLAGHASVQEGNGCWVPYILLVKDDDFTARVKPWLEQQSAQAGAAHFAWRDLGTVQYRGRLVFDGCHSVLHVLHLAVEWRHEAITDSFVNTTVTIRLLHDWTQNWLGHPNSEMTTHYFKLKRTWIAQNITSREIVFTDDGTENPDYASSWIRREKAEEGELEEDESEYTFLQQSLDFEPDAEEGDYDNSKPITEEDVAPYFLLPDDVDNEEITHQGDNDPEGWLD